MSYTPNEWESGDVVTTARMNALETAVGDMNMSYTPNTWSDGDILTAAKMNALEQAVASGGGGSSDFDTAEMTIVTESTEQINAPFIAHAPMEPSFDYINAFSQVVPSGTYDVVLYKGNAVIQILNNATVSGDIEDLSGGMYLVTGDCTITIS